MWIGAFFYFGDVFKRHVPLHNIGGDIYEEQIPEFFLDNPSGPLTRSLSNKLTNQPNITDANETVSNRMEDQNEMKSVSFDNEGGPEDTIADMSSDEETYKQMEQEGEPKNLEEYETQGNQIFKRLDREIRNLCTFYNPHPEETLETAAISNLPSEPMTFQEAWWHEDPIEKEKWRSAIKKEIQDMITKGVWRKLPKTQMPTG